MGEFVKLAKVGDVPPGTKKVFEYRHYRVLVCRTEDGIFVVDDECTHEAASLGEGELLGHEVVCARHGARFDVADGRVTGPPALMPLETYEVKLEGDDILVGFD